MANDPVEFALAMAEAGEGPEVALEATYGYYWAADLLKANGANVHLVHPLGLHWDNEKSEERHQGRHRTGQDGCGATTCPRPGWPRLRSGS